MKKLNLRQRRLRDLRALERGKRIPKKRLADLNKSRLHKRDGGWSNSSPIFDYILDGKL